MSPLDKPPITTTTVKWRFPEVHPEGRKYILIAGAFALVSLFVWDFATWPLIGLAIWVAAFFRDPVRVTPQGDDLIVAPADGLVTMIERVPVPAEMAGENGLGEANRVRVSIFMSVFDVHVNRTPRSEEHTSELQSLMRISYAVFCLKKKKNSRMCH